ncbi:hypothetical protein [Aliikangiella maris]|uniref:Uncharacterized protein n=2 Tax=Aliikangiella maris TaxID=3162458 RepID=A0ABV3MLH8_9GAMM
MKSLVVIILKVSFFTFVSTLTTGCIALDCDKELAKNLIENSERIFAGKAIKSELMDDDNVKTTFEVIEVFKGEADSLEYAYSKVSSLSCDINYIAGLPHIVMVDKNNKVSSCCSYDEYYSENLSYRKDISYRGILEELRRNKK